MFKPRSARSILRWGKLRAKWYLVRGAQRAHSFSHWVFGRRNRKRLLLSSVNTVIITLFFAFLGYLAVTYEYGGAIGRTLQFFHRITPEELTRFEQQIHEAEASAQRRNRAQQRQTERIQELSSDLFQDMGLLNVQSGLITLTDGEAAQIRQGPLAATVTFAAPFWNRKSPSVNVRWKNLVPGEPAPDLRVYNIGYRTFCIVAGPRQDRRPSNIKGKAQIYWTAFGSFDEKPTFRKEPATGCGARFRQSQPIVTPPAEDGGNSTDDNSTESSEAETQKQ